MSFRSKEQRTLKDVNLKKLKMRETVEIEIIIISLRRDNRRGKRRPNRGFWEKNNPPYWNTIKGLRTGYFSAIIIAKKF